MNSINFKHLTLAAFMLAPVFTACGGMEQELGDEDQIEETDDALCTDNGVANVTKTLTINNIVSAISGTSYDGGACDSFLFQVNGISGLPGVTAGSDWPNNDLTEDACPFAVIVTDFYGYDGSVWKKIGHNTSTGHWNPPVTSCDPSTGTCLSWPGSCDVGATKTFDTSVYSKLRVGARASSIIWPADLQVKTSARSAQPPA